MDLESPLRTIASPVEGEALRVLAGADTEFTAPQIHRLVKSGSPYGVRKALARLVNAGLVIERQYGNTVTYLGNRQHLLWPAIETGVDARRTLFDRIATRVERTEGVSAYLYGSVARGTSSPDSDIDILLVFPDAYEGTRIVDFAADLGEAVETWTGNAAQSYSVTREELGASAKRSDPIIDSFRADAVTLVGPEFAQLLAQIEEKSGPWLEDPRRRRSPRRKRVHG